MTSNLSCKDVDVRSENQKKIGPKQQTTNWGFCQTRLVVEHQNSVISCESEPTWVQMGWRPGLKPHLQTTGPHHCGISWRNFGDSAAWLPCLFC